MKGIRLTDIPYPEAEKRVNEDTVVMLPIGGAAKEHGLHLPCGTDYFIVEVLAKMITERCNVLELPILQYGYYPAFIRWPGSISISSRLFMDIVAAIIRPFAERGVRKFVILDIGVSTQPPLRVLAAEMQEALDILVAVTDFSQIWGGLRDDVCEQKSGGHGDEVETSLMLAIHPSKVRMDLATEEYSSPFPKAIVDGRAHFNISRKMKTPHGINGDATLATKEKGEFFLTRSADIVVAFIEDFIRLDLDEV